MEAYFAKNLESKAKEMNTNNTNTPWMKRVLMIRMAAICTFNCGFLLYKRNNNLVRRDLCALHAVLE